MRVAKCPRTLLENPGMVSDSWIYRGIARLQAAIPTATDPGQPLENTSFGCTSLSMDLASSIPCRSLKGYNKIPKDFVLVSL
jgi:hypothetical protein